MRSELRKKFINKKDLFIKMREKEDIVYYKGFKLLSMYGDDSNISFTIDPDTYKFNKDAMEKIFNNSNIERTIEEIYVDRRKSVEKYLSLKLNDIVLNRGNIDSFKNNKVNDNGNDVYTRVSDIVSLINNEYSEYLETVIDDINTILDNLEKNDKYVIKFNKKELSNIKLANLESFIMEKCIFTNKKHDDRTGFSKPSFKFKFEVDHKKILDNLDDFISIRKDSLDDYEKYTGYELEKRYQQDLMLKYRNEKTFPFELEYYTWEKDEGKGLDNSDNRGRIDCIFVNIDENQLKDIYMIELKVNENVVGGTNGVNKHFIDIYNLITNESNLAKFKRLLIERLNTMFELKGKQKIEESKDLKLHFHTIISFAKDKYGHINDHQKNVDRLLKRLNDSEKIKKMKEKKHNPIPKDSKTIYEHLEDLNNNNPKCESFIYYNESYDPINGKISNNFDLKNIGVNE